eukprot:m.925950 g.925950  ORF g.925950 m.925950 type:complete len:90 (-) comp135424_c0_seq1:677-946(-)
MTHEQPHRERNSPISFKAFVSQQEVFKRPALATEGGVASTNLPVSTDGLTHGAVNMDRTLTGFQDGHADLSALFSNLRGRGRKDSQGRD